MKAIRGYPISAFIDSVSSVVGNWLEGITVIGTARNGTVINGTVHEVLISIIDGTLHSVSAHRHCPSGIVQKGGAIVLVTVHDQPFLGIGTSNFINLRDGHSV